MNTAVGLQPACYILLSGLIHKINRILIIRLAEGFMLFYRRPMLPDSRPLTTGWRYNNAIYAIKNSSLMASHDILE